MGAATRFSSCVSQRQMEQSISFLGAGGVSLAGTLTLPEGAARCPALVLVAGSGPTDRDGNQLPAVRTDLLKSFAEALAQKGIASLRYDKRAVGKSGKPSKTQSLSAFADWKNFVGDVELAATWLRKQQGIDPKHVGLLGHSEGGMLCLEASARVRPSGLVLAATPGRPLRVVLHDQLTRMLKQQKATPQQTKFFLESYTRISAQVIKTGKVPKDVPPGLAGLYPEYLGPFLQGMLSLDPVKLARKITCPALVLQGEGDIQVSPTKDAPALNAALKTAHRLVIVPGVSHNFKKIQNSADPAFAGPVLPEALEQLARWTTKSL
jgi:uncharacterized protein